MTAAASLAGLLAGLAVAFAAGAAAPLRRLDVQPSRPYALPRGRAFPPGWSRIVPAGWILATAIVLCGPPLAAVGALVGAAAGVVVRGRHRRAAKQRATALAAVVADGLLALVADLATGQTPLGALTALTCDLEVDPVSPTRRELGSILRVVVTTGHLGGDVSSALREAARIPGAGGLRVLAVAWQVADQIGSPLAGVLDRLAAGIGRDRAASRRLEVALSGARTSARLMLALPLFGLLIGVGLGVSPVTFLLGPWQGRACLVVGVALSALGRWWTDRLEAEARAELLT